MVDVSRAGSPWMRRSLLAAVLVGLLVRLPGVAWGANWPDGFTSHHPDESTHLQNANAMISPLEPHADVPYPKAMAAYVAAPVLLWYAAHGQYGGPRLHVPWIIGPGRLVSVAFGIAAILLVFAVGRDALGDSRAGLAGAWLLALGGLHVTESHFFVADVPVTTWTLLSLWLTWRDLQEGPGRNEYLRWAAFAAGAAFALKLFVLALPALAYAVVVKPQRLLRASHAAVFAAAGLLASSLGFDTPTTLYRTVTLGINAPFTFDRVRGAVLYLVELPSIFSLPLLLLAVSGTWLLARRLASTDAVTRRHALAVFGVAPVVALAFVLFKLDHFARHWVVLVPWAAIAGGWALARALDALQRRRRPTALVLVPVFVWMAAFVIDAERFFILDPRNDAAHWLRSNVPEGSRVYWTWHRAPAGYQSARWFTDGNPDVLVVEMFEANNYLSGVDWRDSYPTDFRHILDGQTAERVAAVQSLFRGTSAYTAVARFPERYVMPEYRVAMTLLGDRARNGISEVVIFRRQAPAQTSSPASGT